MAEMNLAGRTALVTGASRGIGRGIAIGLAEAGADVTVNYTRGEDAAAETVAAIRALGRKAKAYQASVADEAACAAMVAAVEADFGPLSILINNAGIAPFTPFLEIDLALLERVLRVNTIGPFLVTQECVPDMIEAKWGRIINITSSSVQSGSALQTHYTSSKGALLGFTKCLAMALGEHGITANMIPPGSIDTPMLRGAEIMQREGAVEAYGAALPVGRIGTGEDIAAAAAFLASEEAGYMTGQTISVNGGRYMGSA